MSVDDVHDRGNVIVVNIPDTKTYKPRTFTINGSNSIPAIDVFRKYRKLRLESILHKRLFINNHKQKCTVQPFGINIISKFPEKIARFLCLPNSEEYTGHSFRRSSATLLADSGADLAVVKRHGGWRSNSVVEGYIEDFLNNKIEILRKIINHSLTIIQKESTSNSEAHYDFLYSWDRNCSTIIRSEVSSGHAFDQTRRNLRFDKMLCARLALSGPINRQFANCDTIRPERISLCALFFVQNLSLQNAKFRLFCSYIPTRA
ncbi:hypothetical protein TcasGA2_TC004905 [Tribolium castaneum]|uniref:Tyr recombinase domain-containing protein n=1 Tax=Tribolium castaneum TaxID=7070 RepID=D6WCJ2_TRICA|nr:hypothetical protein TcasGA2_TC004905 [Tribolium castaneum]